MHPSKSNQTHVSPVLEIVFFAEDGVGLQQYSTRCCSSIRYYLNVSTRAWWMLSNMCLMKLGIGVVLLFMSWGLCSPHKWLSASTALRYGVRGKITAIYFSFIHLKVIICTQLTSTCYCRKHFSSADGRDSSPVLVLHRCMCTFRFCIPQVAYKLLCW